MSNPGDVVFDMFAGSAITLKVCIENNRNSILCDKDVILKDYVDKQLKLLKEKYNYELQYEEE